METARCGWPSHPATQVSLQMHAPCAIRHSKNRSTSHCHSQAYLTGSSTHASVHPSICTPVQPPHPNHAPPPQQISLRDHPMDPPSTPSPPSSQSSSPSPSSSSPSSPPSSPSPSYPPTPWRSAAPRCCPPGARPTHLRYRRARWRRYLPRRGTSPVQERPS